MKNIMTLEEFLLSNKNLRELNEGLFTNLFGALFKKDMWSQVKGSNEIKKQFREIDNNLHGFDLTKIKNPNASQNVRQTLVSWADDIYSAKKKAKDDGAKLKDLLKKIGKRKKSQKNEDEKKETNDKIKELNKKVDDIDKKYQKKLDDYTKDPELKRWSDLLKNEMGFVLDKVLCGEFDKEGEFEKDIKEIEKKNVERLKDKSEEEEKEMNKALNELKKMREDVLKGCGAEIYTKDAKEYLKDVKDTIGNKDLYESIVPIDKNMVKGEKVGKGILKELLGIDFNTDSSETNEEALYKTLRLFDEIILSNVENDFKESFESLQGESLQAAFVSYCNLVLISVSNLDKSKVDGKFFNLMARCAIYGHPTLGFGLPCPDEQNKAGVEEKDRKSLFAFYVNKTLDYDDKKLITDDEKRNIDKICNDIIKEANEMVEDYDKEQKEKLKKKEQEQSKENEE